MRFRFPRLRRRGSAVLIRCWDEIAYRDPARACLAVVGILGCIAIIAGRTT